MKSEIYDLKDEVVEFVINYLQASKGTFDVRSPHYNVGFIIFVFSSGTPHAQRMTGIRLISLSITSIYLIANISPELIRQPLGKSSYQLID